MHAGSQKKFADLALSLPPFRGFILMYPQPLRFTDTDMFSDFSDRRGTLEQSGCLSTSLPQKPVMPIFVWVPWKLSAESGRGGQQNPPW
jgi:hypothetical protein